MSWKIMVRRGIGYRWYSIDVAESCEEGEKKILSLTKVLSGDFRLVKTTLGKGSLQSGGAKAQRNKS